MKLRPPHLRYRSCNRVICEAKVRAPTYPWTVSSIDLHPGTGPLLYQLDVHLKTYTRNVFLYITDHLSFWGIPIIDNTYTNSTGSSQSMPTCFFGEENLLLHFFVHTTLWQLRCFAWRRIARLLDSPVLQWSDDSRLLTTPHPRTSSPHPYMTISTFTSIHGHDRTFPFVSFHPFEQRTTTRTTNVSHMFG